MHSIKGGWVGQTFALANRNESDGRKTRIRRSKEERKTMVESFIKKYQESNNGNFPSLNLTHKEVGGSFYTVREIVRDVIQENRVLGPAKFNLQELTSDQFFELNPLGSIARDPQSFSAPSSNENHPEPFHHLDSSGKKVSVSDEYYTGAEHQEVVNVSQVDVLNKEWIEATVLSDDYYGGTEHVVVDKGHVVNGGQVEVTNSEFIEATVVSEGYRTGAEHQVVDNGLVINGNLVDLTDKESGEANNPEMQVSEPTTPKQNVEQELATAATSMAKVIPATQDLIVETFPVKPVASTTDGIEALGELRGSSNLPENDISTVELEKGLEKYDLNGAKPTNTSNLLDEKFEDGLGNEILKNTGEDEGKSLGDTLAESTKPSIHKELQNTKTFEALNQGQVVDGPKTCIQDDFQAKNLTNIHTEGSKPSEEVPQKPNKLRVDGKIGGSGNSERRSNTTLDRINLESWDGTSKNSAKQETNRLLAIFKAFVDAVVKFWSD